MSLSKLLATVIFLSASPLISVPDATFATLSRRGTPKDILRGGGKRHACLSKADRRHNLLPSTKTIHYPLSTIH